MSYTRESCIKLILNNLVELSDDDYHEILKFPIIKEIRNNIVYFNVDKYKDIIKNKPSLRKYGVAEYTTEEIVIRGKNNAIDSTKNYETNEYDSELHSIWGKINSLEGFNECMPLVWELRISNDMYLKLKTALSNYLNKCNIKKEKILQKYSQAIFVYNITEMIKTITETIKTTKIKMH